MSLPFAESDASLFLNGEPQWKSRLGEGWKGTKLLGKGGHGVVGLWEYKGPAKNAPTITQIVVKMSESLPDLFPEPQLFPKSKIDEGVTLKKLAECGSRHIVRQYGGNRMGDWFGEIGQVVKVFLEYCPAGDCSRFLAPYKEEPLPPLVEVDVWALFHCMALGIAVMARGTEDINKTEWGGVAKETELVHFDLKADNIFLGFRDDDHTRMPIAKIGDLGEAYEVMAPRFQDDEYGASGSRRGMEYYNPPESHLPSQIISTLTNSPQEETLWNPNHPFNIRQIPVPKPIKGTCSNIWQIGAIMNQLLLRVQKRFDDDAAADQCTTTNIDPECKKLVEFPNHSLDLETQEIMQLYTLPLITIIMECLLRPPLLRPSAVELVQRTGDGYKVATRAAKFPRREIPKGMDEIPFISSFDLEPPLAWDVDDTTLEYLEATYRNTKAAGSVERPTNRASTSSSGYRSFLPSIFSRRSMDSSARPGSSSSRGSVFSIAKEWGSRIVTGGSELGSRSGDVETKDDWEEVELVNTIQSSDTAGIEEEELAALYLSPSARTARLERQGSAEQTKGKGCIAKSPPPKKSPKKLRFGV